MGKLRALIVEDDVLISMDIDDILREHDIDVIGIARSASQALDMLHSRAPDIALLDITIQGSDNGIDIARVIRKDYNIPFIFLTSHADKVTLDEAKKTLPYGYIVKPFQPKDIYSTIEMAIYRHAQENQSELYSLDELNASLMDSLTDREYLCLQQINEGMTNKQIAESLFVSVNTVKTHLKNLYAKLQVSNRTMALKIAKRR